MSMHEFAQDMAIAGLAFWAVVHVWNTYRGAGSE